MEYEGRVYRPPSEAHSYILQATIGCSWNKCIYCEMYTGKQFRVRPLQQSLTDLETIAAVAGDRIEKVFVADGDALIMPLEVWMPILAKARELLPRLRQVSSYAMARNINDKSDDELLALREAGLTTLYLGPESGDDVTLKRIAKGDDFAAHAQAADKAHKAGMKLSVITLLGAGGVQRSLEHAQATARLVTAMDPEYLAALTLTVIPGTPIGRMQEKGRFELPSVTQMLRELRVIVDECKPSNALFRTNHASNYLPLAGRLPQDRQNIVSVIDEALAGGLALRPEWTRGL